MMTITDVLRVLETHDPALDATPILRALITKPRAQAKPKIPAAVADTSTLTDTAVRVYFKGRDLYDSTLFHAKHGKASHAESFEALAQAVLREGNTTALWAGYRALVDRARAEAEAERVEALTPAENDCKRKVYCWSDDVSDGRLATRICEYAEVPKGWWRCDGTRGDYDGTRKEA